MDGFNATPEELGRASGIASATYEQVNGELGVLRGRVSELVAGWSGDASGRFVGVMARWDTSARSLTAALEEISTALRTSGAVYLAREADASSSVSQISEALG